MMKDFVIYTVLVGDYDDIMQPKVIDNRFDYILFSNDFKESTCGVWEIKSIPNVMHGDNKRLSRYPKSHPEDMLSDYKASLYIDANIQIVRKWVYDRFVELYEKGVEYAGIKLVLTGHDCIYDHAFEMCQFLVEHESNAIRQCHELYKRGFPRHFGLNENNVIFRKHTKRMKQVDEEWWWWIKNYSFRDQFSYMYCIWKYQVPLVYFLPDGQDARTSTAFNLIQHNGKTNVIKLKIVKRGFVEKLRVKCKSLEKDKYLQKWHSIYKSKHYMLHLYLDGILVILCNLPKLLIIFVKRFFR